MLVIRSHRCSLAGCDLNRKWGNPNKVSLFKSCTRATLHEWC